MALEEMAAEEEAVRAVVGAAQVLVKLPAGQEVSVTVVCTVVAEVKVVGVAVALATAEGGAAMVVVWMVDAGLAAAVAVAMAEEGMALEEMAAEEEAVRAMVGAAQVLVKLPAGQEVSVTVVCTVVAEVKVVGVAVALVTAEG